MPNISDRQRLLHSLHTSSKSQQFNTAARRMLTLKAQVGECQRFAPGSAKHERARTCTPAHTHAQKKSPHRYPMPKDFVSAKRGKPGWMKRLCWDGNVSTCSLRIKVCEPMTGADGHTASVWCGPTSGAFEKDGPPKEAWMATQRDELR